MFDHRARLLDQLCPIQPDNLPAGRRQSQVPLAIGMLHLSLTVESLPIQLDDETLVCIEKVDPTDWSVAVANDDLTPRLGYAERIERAYEQRLELTLGRHEVLAALREQFSHQTRTRPTATSEFNEDRGEIGDGCPLPDEGIVEQTLHSCGRNVDPTVVA